MTSYVSIKGIK